MPATIGAPGSALAVGALQPDAVTIETAISVARSNFAAHNTSNVRDRLLNLLGRFDATTLRLVRR
ncbi:hypothetical protein FNL55_20220 [Tardiphaga sp. vice352]|uniref:hypothetical protein n=1 Tax=unclassified Tardiphaga TaxID=2631404 RepID=UPI001163A5B8|nr:MULTISPECIES: hypothetical protein [unclassified Tardiphaga]QDM18067.1 hypothetical protein FNL53_20550 [Tardiphaga sp. vice278]QDM28276.1 hypothetical protein FNL56_20735 [Tardiphaga sp. vice304]QDM33415.1 hypothetical protein FNL55_20220 [Tardiphaga sp. vice352]